MLTLFSANTQGTLNEKLKQLSHNYPGYGSMMRQLWGNYKTVIYLRCLEKGKDWRAIMRQSGSCLLRKNLSKESVLSWSNSLIQLTTLPLHN